MMAWSGFLDVSPAEPFLSPRPSVTGICTAGGFFVAVKNVVNHRRYMCSCFWVSDHRDMRLAGVTKALLVDLKPSTAGHVRGQHGILVFRCLNSRSNSFLNSLLMLLLGASTVAESIPSQSVMTPLLMQLVPQALRHLPAAICER